MKIVVLIVLVLSTCACSSGFGNKLKSEKLDVYYDDSNLAALADSLGSYWTKNDLIGDRKQSIKLVKSGAKYQVLIIQSNEFKSEKLEPTEIALLENLKSELQSTIFNNKSTSIVICNDEFESIIEIK